MKLLTLCIFLLGCNVEANIPEIDCQWIYKSTYTTKSGSCWIANHDTHVKVTYHDDSACSSEEPRIFGPNESVDAWSFLLKSDDKGVIFTKADCDAK